MLIDSDVGGRILNPTSRVEVLNAVFRPLHRRVGVAAENPLHIVGAGVGQRARRDFDGVSPPAGVEPVNQLRQAPLPEIQFLQ